MMETHALPTELVIFVLGLPFAGFLFHALFGGLLLRALGERTGKWLVGAVGTGVVFGAFGYSVLLLQAMLSLPEEARRATYTLADWLAVGSVRASFEFLVDPLSVLMCLVVTGIGGLIHLYATGYMAEDEDYPRFFTYFNLFIFFMLTLVLAGNFLVMFIGWEGVGLCSYLLIGYFYRNAEWRYNTDSANKAFIVNRIGDLGFLLAMFIIVAMFGTLSFGEVNARAAEVLGVDTGLATAVALLLFLAATGKSAQLPLYFWLPDAMAGPTPVSALIHAATMVTAGVYLLTRVHPLFEIAPAAMIVVAAVGAFTAIFAASVALGQTDIKRVLAFSTVSQLGYMFLACGVGAFWVGMFHVATHAFFKALLFLGAGSVLIALHHRGDIRQMGGLRRYLPITAATMVIGLLAISGFPPFSGYWSKEAILLSAYSSRLTEWMPLLFGVGVATALLTALYMTRLTWLVFFAPAASEKEAHGHAPERERYRVVLGVLIVLAIGSILFGWVLPSEHAVHEFLKPSTTPVHLASGVAGEPATGKTFVMLTALLAALLGLGLGITRYRAGMPVREAQLQGLWGVLNRQWGYDGVMRWLGVQLGGAIAWITGVLIEGLIDGLVDLAGVLTRGLGNRVRALQSGYVRSYAFVMMLGALVILIVVLIYGWR
ncbi:MAG: NADH-quinone oxidoreductase subunit L [Fimbriimonadales bacterium]|nr:NADH-quinone oxidoreductase subunit L [Fimbriimonadales bacterium]